MIGMGSALLLAGCGTGGDAATEQRIQRERQEAAVIAKQEERIKQLERERRAAGRRAPSVTVVQAAPRRNPTPPAPAAPRSPERFDDWPGGSGYTTILASVSSESEARRIQAQASERGLDAGVLRSSSYRSLRPGYWVVFSGTSSSKQDADQRTGRAKSLGYSDAYPRFVSG